MPPAKGSFQHLACSNALHEFVCFGKPDLTKTKVVIVVVVVVVVVVV